MPSQHAARLLLDHLKLLADQERALPVLDLACGRGRNGLLLAELGIPVVFADRSADALSAIEQRLAVNDLPGKTWQVDLEQPGVNPFSGQRFSAVIAFRYLHRPLFPALLDAVTPGGLVLYETFNLENRQFGRPNNPDFLLRAGELQAIFEGWNIIHSFDGVMKNPDRGVSHIVAQKPGHSL